MAGAEPKKRAWLPLAHAIPSAAIAAAAALEGRLRLLHLAGTSWFGSSLGWFLETYRRLGVEFDEIWAWELVPLVPPVNYWDGVPKDIAHKLHVSRGRWGEQMLLLPPRQVELCTNCHERHSNLEHACLLSTCSHDFADLSNALIVDVSAPLSPNSSTTPASRQTSPVPSTPSTSFDVLRHQAISVRQYWSAEGNGRNTSIAPAK